MGKTDLARFRRIPFTDKSDMRKPNDGVCYFVGWGYCYMQEHLYSEEWTSKMIMSDTIWTETNNYFSAGTAISANCAHPELAFQILNLVNTDPYVATMMRFGIEADDTAGTPLHSRYSTPPVLTPSSSTPPCVLL